MSKGGRIKQINGLLDTINSVPDVIDYEQRYQEGDTVPEGNTLKQIVLRFVLVCETKKHLAEDIQIINNGVEVLDDEGKDMCLRFSPQRLFEEE